MEAVKFVVGKLQEALAAVLNLGVEALAWVFPPETRDNKVNSFPLALKNSGDVTLAWFDKIFPPETRVDKFKNFQLALKNSGDVTLAWFHKVFPPETRVDKFKNFQLALKNPGEVMLAWFDNIFPPETRAYWLHIAKPYLVPAAILTMAVWVFRRCCGGGGGGRPKMMKAPGRNYRMPRHEFERSPKEYFRSHRGRK